MFKHLNLNPRKKKPFERQIIKLLLYSIQRQINTKFLNCVASYWENDSNTHKTKKNTKKPQKLIACNLREKYHY